MNLTELRAQVQAKKAESQAKVAEMIETKQLQAQLTALTNDKLQEAKANQALTKATSDTLATLMAACENIVKEMPSYNKKTREQRKWSPRREYGLGNQFAELSGLLTGILYSTTDHKVQMLALTGLDIDTIEAFVAAVGKPAYFNETYNTMQIAEPYNLPKLLDTIALIEDILEVNIDKSKLTEAHMSARFALAQAKADQAEAEYLDGEETQTLNVA